jgi:hypothetical protein
MNLAASRCHHGDQAPAGGGNQYSVPPAPAGTLAGSAGLPPRGGGGDRCAWCVACHWLGDHWLVESGVRSVCSG